MNSIWKPKASTISDNRRRRRV